MTKVREAHSPVRHPRPVTPELGLEAPSESAHVAESLDDDPVRVGHVLDVFWPGYPGSFVYRIATNPLLKGPLFCNRRVNAGSLPHDNVTTPRLSKVLRRRIEGAFSVKLGRYLAAKANEWEWRQFLRRAKPDVLYVHFGDVAVRFLPLLSKTEIPFVVTFHGSDVNAATYRNDYLPKLRQVFAKAAYCHFVSETLLREAVSIGCPEEQARMIYLGMPIPNATVEYTDRTDSCRFACAASFVPCKGHETLLKAFAKVLRQLPRASLDLYGTGPLRDRLAWVVSELGLDSSVCFHGEIPQGDVQTAFLTKTDVVLLASRRDDLGRREGLPLTLNEAAAVGLPVVATRCGGISELVRHGETGLLVESDDVDSLADAMTALGQQPAVRVKLGTEARSLVLEHFNAERQFPKLARLLRRAAERKDTSSLS